MFRSRSWFGSGGLWKPKNPHSLDHLKYLYNVLSKNQTVSESNRSLLVETLRSIAEILIWGDQNDSTVFDFFLEKNMLSFFLKIMKQKCGSYVCVQLLQTLNILFENIRNETSLYYLLSNNHVNSIIIHKFDFSDEEVMAYYISFLKTLSLKLNHHTIHFFYNEHTHDFPLYTEAIKFFNNSESMVRIAVRTLTLNVYKITDNSMLEFIRDRTAAPYFSNLVWFIGNHVQELDACIRQNAESECRVRLADVVAEHLDHLHYLNDILSLEITDLNQVLTEHLLQRLFIPLYIASLDRKLTTSQSEEGGGGGGGGRVSRILSLFLISQVFLIMTHPPLVHLLANILLHGDETVLRYKSDLTPPRLSFSSPPTTPSSPPPDIHNNTDSHLLPKNSKLLSSSTSLNNEVNSSSDEAMRQELNRQYNSASSSTLPNEGDEEINMSPDGLNRHLTLSNDYSPASLENHDNNDQIDTDETREEGGGGGRKSSKMSPNSSPHLGENRLKGLEELLRRRGNEGRDGRRRIISSIFESLDATENDYAPLFTLCLLHALYDNKGIDPELLSSFFHGSEDEDEAEEKEENSEVVPTKKYNEQLVQRLLSILMQSVKKESRVRVITVQLLLSLLIKISSSSLSPPHLASIETARLENIRSLQSSYRADELFLEVFEDEWIEMSSRREMRVEHEMMDSTLLLPPVGSPLTGISFDKRLPCGEGERTRRAMRLYFLLRKTLLALRGETETLLPLTSLSSCVAIDENIDLTNSDMLSCIVVPKDNVKTRRFLVVDDFQLILVDPSTKKLGWGVVKFVGFLQDIDVLGDKDDSRCLHITVKTSPTSQRGSKTPLLAAKFIFDDQIRCMAAKQRLVKRKQKARQIKLHIIAKLLDLSGSSPSPPQNARRATNRRLLSRSERPLFTPLSRTLPGLAIKSSSSPPPPPPLAKSGSGTSIRSASSSSAHEEEIPLGSMRKLKKTQHLSSQLNYQEEEERRRREGGGGGSKFKQEELRSPGEMPQSETSFMNIGVGDKSANSSPSHNTPSRSKKRGEIETV